MIKLIAVDYDGTFLKYKDDKREINRELIEELNDFIRRGGQAGFVSGRHVWDFYHCFMENGIEWHQPFPSFIIERDAYFYERDMEGNLTFPEVNNDHKNSSISQMRKVATHIDKILTLIESVGVPCPNYVLEGDNYVEFYLEEDQVAAAKAAELLKEYIKDKEDISQVNVYANGDVLTIYPNGGGKGMALERACTHYGLKPEEIICFGDSYNDLSMLAGDHDFVRVCVGSGVEEVIEKVREKGGIIGEGEACDSVLNVLLDFKAQGKLL